MVTAGQDFGLNITNVKVGWIGKAVYVIADYGAYNMPTRTFNEELTEQGWYENGDGTVNVFPTFCDPAGGERIQEISGGVKANNSLIPELITFARSWERNQFFICTKCTGVLRR